MNKIYRETAVKETAFQLVKGDITKEQVDAIVNAANNYLSHGGGVAGVISRAGGPLIQQLSDDWIRKHGPVKHEKPAWTAAGKLPCTYVIHAVGPVWGSGDEDRKLADAVHGSLELADELEITSISLPAISCGIYRFPVERAARIIISTINDYLHQQTGLRIVRLVLYDKPILKTFEAAWEEILA